MTTVPVRGQHNLTVVLAATSILLAGCSDIDKSGPLSSSANSSHYCLEMAAKSSVLMGQAIIRNKGTDTLRINAIGLRDAQNMSLDAVYLLAIKDSTLIGAGAPFSGTESWLTDAVAPGADARIQPGEELNIAAIVQRSSDAAEGHYEGLEIEYADAETEYATVNLDAVTLVRDQDDCKTVE